MKWIFPILIALVIFSSCKKDKFYSGNDNVLTFEADTLTFDTVFTTVGTITRYLKVNNTSNQDLRIDEIQIAEGDASPFKINVDGVSVLGSSIENVEILANDYIYIFVEATLGENNANDPLIVLNELQYLFNGNQQSSYLRAWGRDAYFHFGEIYESENVTWQNDKPHVIVRNGEFPGVGVDSFSVLNILHGTEVFASVGSGIFVDGILNVGMSGSIDSVTFQSNRIEDLPNGLEFGETAGLWYGINLLSGSVGNFHNVCINNATYGILGRLINGSFFDYSNSSRPTITLEKVKIKNSAASALFALNSNVTATNCLFYAAGSNLVGLTLGGEYSIDNCTFYNTGGSGLSHQDEVLALTNFAANQNGGAIADLEQANITNCIVYGSLNEEILLSNDDLGIFNYEFKNCLVRTELSIADSATFVACIANENPNFEDLSESDYTPADNSPCLDAGFNNGVTEDLFFNPRNTGVIDIGAIERL